MNEIEPAVWCIYRIQDFSSVTLNIYNSVVFCSENSTDYIVYSTVLQL